MEHTAGPICIECQSGYVLNDTICIREAVFLNETNSTIPPVVTNDTPTLTEEEITQQLGNQSKLFNESDAYFRAKYSIAEAEVKEVQSLETKAGTFLRIEYRTNGSNYQAVAFFNKTQNLSEWSFGEISTREDPIQADIYLRQVFGGDLEGFDIYNIEK